MGRVPSKEHNYAFLFDRFLRPLLWRSLLRL